MLCPVGSARLHEKGSRLYPLALPTLCSKLTSFHSPIISGKHHTTWCPYQWFALKTYIINTNDDHAPQTLETEMYKIQFIILDISFHTRFSPSTDSKDQCCSVQSCNTTSHLTTLTEVLTISTQFHEGRSVNFDLMLLQNALQSPTITSHVKIWLLSHMYHGGKKFNRQNEQHKFLSHLRNEWHW